MLSREEYGAFSMALVPHFMCSERERFVFCIEVLGIEMSILQSADLSGSPAGAAHNLIGVLERHGEIAIIEGAIKIALRTELPAGIPRMEK